MQVLKLTGGHAQAPDSVGLSIEDDLDLRIRVAMDDWSPSGRQVFMAKSTGDEEWSFHTASDGSGLLELVWVDTNPTTFIEQSTVAPGFDNGTMHWVRVRRSGTSVTFYTSDDDTDDHSAVSWSQLGDVVTTGSGDIDSTLSTAVCIGAARINDSDASVSDDPLLGIVRAAAILEDTTVRADPVFSSAEWSVGDEAGDTGSDGTNTWTLKNKASVVGENIYDVHLSCEISFGSDPFYDTAVWTDITSDLRHTEFSRGRQYELDRIDAGTMTVTLSNAHGNYNAHNTASPHYPNIKPTVPIRLRAIYNNRIYPLWQGFVERWPVSFPQMVDSVVEVQCVDLFKLLALAKARTADRETAVDALSPVAWWRFSGSPGTADETGTGHTLTFSGSPTLEQTGAWLEDEAVSFDGTDDYATVANDADVTREGEAMSWEVWCRPEGSAATLYYLFSIGDFAVEWQAISASFSSGFGLMAGDGVADKWNHVVLTHNGTGTFNLYVNGADAGSSTNSIETPLDSATVYIGRDAAGDFLWEGDISEVAVYPTVLTHTQVQTLFAAAREGYADQLTSARIAFVLDGFAFPVTPPQRLETGQSTIDGPNSPTDQTLLEAIQTAAETENGLFFISAAGEAVFQDRYYRSDDQGTANAIFGPQNLPYVDVRGFGVDDERVYNDIHVASDDSSDPFVVVNQDSLEAHGRRTLERTIYPANANEALDAAYWLANLYSTPRPRIDGLGFRLGADPDLWDAILSAEISNRYTVKVPLGGDDFDEDMYLEGMTHAVTVGGPWDVTFQLSPALDFTVWVLDDDNLSILDDTTVLAY